MKNQMGLIAKLWCGKKQKQNTEVEDKNNRKYPVWRTVRNKDCKDVKSALVTHETIKSSLKYALLEVSEWRWENGVKTWTCRSAKFNIP